MAAARRTARAAAKSKPSTARQIDAESKSQKSAAATATATPSKRNTRRKATETKEETQEESLSPEISNPEPVKTRGSRRNVAASIKTEEEPVIPEKPARKARGTRHPAPPENTEPEEIPKVIVEEPKPSRRGRPTKKVVAQEDEATVEVEDAQPTQTKPTKRNTRTTKAKAASSPLEEVHTAQDNEEETAAQESTTKTKTSRRGARSTKNKLETEPVEEVQEPATETEVQDEVPAKKTRGTRKKAEQATEASPDEADAPAKPRTTRKTKAQNEITAATDDAEQEVTAEIEHVITVEKPPARATRNRKALVPPIVEPTEPTVPKKIPTRRGKRGVIAENDQDKQEYPVVTDDVPVIELADDEPSEDVEMKEAQEEPASESHSMTHTTITVEVPQKTKVSATRGTKGKKVNTTVASRSTRRGKTVDIDATMEEKPQTVDENTETETMTKDTAVVHPPGIQQEEAQPSATDDAHTGPTDINSDMKEGVPPTTGLEDQESMIIDVVETTSKSKGKNQTAKHKKATTTTQRPKALQRQKEEQAAEIQGEEPLVIQQAQSEAIEVEDITVQEPTSHSPKQSSPVMRSTTPEKLSAVFGSPVSKLIPARSTPSADAAVADEHDLNGVETVPEQVESSSLAAADHASQTQSTLLGSVEPVSETSPSVDLSILHTTNPLFAASSPINRPIASPIVLNTRSVDNSSLSNSGVLPPTPEPSSPHKGQEVPKTPRPEDEESSTSKYDEKSSNTGTSLSQLDEPPQRRPSPSKSSIIEKGIELAHSISAKLRPTTPKKIENIFSSSVPAIQGFFSTTPTVAAVAMKDLGNPTLTDTPQTDIDQMAAIIPSKSVEDSPNNSMYSRLLTVPSYNTPSIIRDMFDNSDLKLIPASLDSMMREYMSDVDSPKGPNLDHETPMLPPALTETPEKPAMSVEGVREVAEEIIHEGNELLAAFIKGRESKQPASDAQEAKTPPPGAVTGDASMYFADERLALLDSILDEEEEDSESSHDSPRPPRVFHNPFLNSLVVDCLRDRIKEGYKTKQQVLADTGRSARPVPQALSRLQGLQTPMNEASKASSVVSTPDSIRALFESPGPTTPKMLPALFETPKQEVTQVPTVSESVKQVLSSTKTTNSLLQNVDESGLSVTDFLDRSEQVSSHDTQAVEEQVSNTKKRRKSVESTTPSKSPRLDAVSITTPLKEDPQAPPNKKERKNSPVTPKKKTSSPRVTHQNTDSGKLQIDLDFPDFSIPQASSTPAAKTRSPKKSPTKRGVVVDALSPVVESPASPGPGVKLREVLDEGQDAFSKGESKKRRQAVQDASPRKMRRVTPSPEPEVTGESTRDEPAKIPELTPGETPELDVEASIISELSPDEIAQLEKGGMTPLQKRQSLGASRRLSATPSLRQRVISNNALEVSRRSPRRSMSPTKGASMETPRVPKIVEGEFESAEGDPSPLRLNEIEKSYEPNASSPLSFSSSSKPDTPKKHVSSVESGVVNLEEETPSDGEHSASDSGVSPHRRGERITLILNSPGQDLTYTSELDADLQKSCLEQDLLRLTQEPDQSDNGESDDEASQEEVDYEGDEDEDISENVPELANDVEKCDSLKPTSANNQVVRPLNSPNQPLQSSPLARSTHASSPEILSPTPTHFSVPSLLVTPYKDRLENQSGEASTSLSKCPPPVFVSPASNSFAHNSYVSGEFHASPGKQMVLYNSTLTQEGSVSSAAPSTPQNRPSPLTGNTLELMSTPVVGDSDLNEFTIDIPGNLIFAELVPSPANSSRTTLRIQFSNSRPDNRHSLNLLNQSTSPSRTEHKTRRATLSGNMSLGVPTPKTRNTNHPDPARVRLSYLGTSPIVTEQDVLVEQDVITLEEAAKEEMEIAAATAVVLDRALEYTEENELDLERTEDGTTSPDPPDSTIMQDVERMFEEAADQVKSVNVSSGANIDSSTRESPQKISLTRQADEDDDILGGFVAKYNAKKAAITEVENTTPEQLESSNVHSIPPTVEHEKLSFSVSTTNQRNNAVQKAMFDAESCFEVIPPQLKEKSKTPSPVKDTKPMTFDISHGDKDQMEALFAKVIETTRSQRKGTPRLPTKKQNKLSLLPVAAGRSKAPVSIPVPLPPRKIKDSGMYAKPTPAQEIDFASMLANSVENLRLSQLSQRELAKVTAKNTTENGIFQTIMFEREVVHKSIPRPPSPNAKRRSVLAASSRKRRQEIESETGIRLGPGDEFDYAPRNASSSVKTVRWDDKLEVVFNENDAVPVSLPAETDDRLQKAPKSVLKINTSSRFGNFDPEKHPVSTIKISKILYRGEKDYE